MLRTIPRFPAIGHAAPIGTTRVIEASLHLLDDLVDAEARRPLARRVFLESLQELTNHGGTDLYCAGSIRNEPVVIGVGGDIGSLIGIGPQVEQLRHAQARERLGPDAQRPRRALLLEH